MTMIHYLPTAVRPSPQSVSGWVDRVSTYVSLRRQEWRRERMLRTLEGLPAETLKDIGWPTTDSDRIARSR